MALKACPECNKDVSDAASSCPHCGFKFSNKIGYTENQYEGKNVMLIGTAVMVLGAIMAIGGMAGNPNLSAIGILVFIGGFIAKKVGKTKNWYHN